ncbi:hypothetical protein G6L86_18920 [Agrobacterium tumefaciens]|uniref:hypothetical protein n=1 Tax=Agrobacterium tumefaciens TaxID=358 RepID=UPI001572273D|nr:hypothetical protein [Agrobacterium tumefaciens]NSX87680.1 hypothetical protein [Agrobacterium tumefaciens]
MSKGRSETHELARQLFRDQKKVLDLIKRDRPDSGFATAVFRLFGDKPERGKTVRIGKHEFDYSSHEKSLVSFLPARWREELDKTKGAWSGCENWWAGYPLIAWVEIRAADDGTTAHLKLHAEVGPVSDHKVRQGIIEAIRMAASAKGMERIQFPVGASDKGRLYSRFLRENPITVSDIRNADEIEKKFVELIAGFEPEFELVSSVIPKFGRANAP